VNALTLFGLLAVSAMLVCYALESRSHWFVLLFAVSCALGSAYGFLQGAWPFGLVEAVWSIVALKRWIMVQKSCRLCENEGANDGRAIFDYAGPVVSTKDSARQEQNAEILLIAVTAKSFRTVCKNFATSPATRWRSAVQAIFRKAPIWIRSAEDRQVIAPVVLHQGAWQVESDVLRADVETPGKARQRSDAAGDRAHWGDSKEAVGNPGHIVTAGTVWAIKQCRKMPIETVWRFNLRKEREGIHFEGRAF
jgi:hypothetical protein